MFLHQGLAGGNYVFCLGVKQADGLDISFQTILAERGDCLRCIGLPVESASGKVDTDIRGLGGKDDRDQQFKIGLVFELGGWRWIDLLQPPEKFYTVIQLHGHP